MSSTFLNDWFLPVRVTYKNTSTCCLLVSFEISKGSPDQDTTNFRQMYVTCANASVALVKTDQSYAFLSCPFFLKECRRLNIQARLTRTNHVGCLALEYPGPRGSSFFFFSRNLATKRRHSLSSGKKKKRKTSGTRVAQEINYVFTRIRRCF